MRISVFGALAGVLVALGLVALPSGAQAADPVELAKLVAADPRNQAAFGYSVAVSGNTIVVGAYGENDFRGAVYVFSTQPDGSVTPTARLTASDADVGDDLGWSVAMSGDTVVAGALEYRDGNRGSVYLFTKPVGGWTDATETAKLTASDTADGDFLGWSVAVSGDTAVAGAPNADNGGSTRGSAYVFTKPVGGWTDATQTATLTASDTADGDQLGYAVAVSGDTVGAGAPNADNGGSNRGSAYLFTRPVGGWTDATQTATLTASDTADADRLGYAVAVSGGTVVAGAPFHGGFDRGAGYVFTKPFGGWTSGTETAKLTASDNAEGDQFGSSVAVSGDTVLIGAPLANSFRGSGYVFTKPGGGWTSGTQTAKLTASDGADGDRFAVSVAVSGGSIVAGAPFAANGGSYLGSAYVFASPPGAPTITTVRAGDRSASVAFTAPTSNGGAEITEYQYRLNGSGSWMSLGTTTSPASITGLTNGTTYRVQLRAVNAAGTGPASNTVSVTPKSKPTPKVKTKLTVTALPARDRLPVARPTRVVTRVTSNGKKTIKATCTVRGKKVKRVCDLRVTRNRVIVTPLCNNHVKVRVTVTAKKAGATRTTWSRTWKVAKKPVTTCSTSGKE